MFNHASNEKVWHIRQGIDRELTNELALGLGLLPATASLLALRGYTTPEAARAFLRGETENLHDPFRLKDMDKAVARIRRAIAEGEKIIVYGDYDVDGVTSVAILYSYLVSCKADAAYYIPNRAGEGYGVNADALRTFAAGGVKLMITVDTGITAIDEIAAAREFGLDTVVTDHHECRPDLPDCAAVVNPKRADCTYPFKELAGVGVAFKLICALEKELRQTTLTEAVRVAAKRYGELVAVGTIADVMPLTDENRIIVRYGLKLLEHPSSVGMCALMRAAGIADESPDGSFVLKKKITSTLIGFTVAPRINAAGRISDAAFAVELFLTADRGRADEIAAELCEINRSRQARESEIIEAADEKIASQCSPDDAVIVLDDDGWHHGVIGIVCSRLTDRFGLPSILVSFEGNGTQPSENDIGKGSGRSVKGFNLVEALAACGETLVKYGGHELAAGLSIERSKLPEFRRAINAYAAKAFALHPPERTVEIDLLLKPSEITIGLASELYLLEPFGVMNTQPVFMTERLTLSAVTALSNGKHTKLILCGGGLSFTALCFGMATAGFGFAAGDTVDLVYNLDVNEFRGRSSAQLVVREIRRSADRSGPLGRDDFARLYTCLKNNLSDAATAPDLAPGGNANWCRETTLAEAAKVDTEALSVMLAVFEEMGLIALTRSGDEVSARPLPVKEKINLDTSEIYRRHKLLWNETGKYNERQHQ